MEVNGLHGDQKLKRKRPKLERTTSTFSLLSPDSWSLRGKRKQASRDADSLSLCSLDINEPSTKRNKLLSRVTSLVSLLPPVKTAPLKRIGETLQRSISSRNVSQTERAAHPPPPSSSSSSTLKMRVISATVSNPSSSMTTPRVSTATAPAAKRRDSKLWSETFDVRLGATQPLSPKEIKRQEAIFELAQGEQDLVEDLKLAKKAYRDPMQKLKIMTEQELNQIFGTLDSLIPPHEDLLSRLREARKPDGSTENVGPILTDWLPCLSSYTSYCSNQVKAKSLLDQKKQDRRVQDFLQRCRQSPFSRKLGLWNFLDIPRSRLVKYPLLLREILKHTANDHPDRQHLDEAMLMVQSVVADINRRTGESECQYYKDRLLYTEYGRRDELIDRSRTLSCHGVLKNNRGLKLHVFLFQDVLAITRSVSLNDHPVSYQLCRQPIPIRQLDLEDLSDGEMRVGGSIRGAFSNNERTKNFFRVSDRTGSQLQSHCFQASDAFNKQQWINCIRQAKEAAALTGDQPPQTGQCLETGLGGQIGPLGGQIGPLGETGQSLCGDSAHEDGKGVWVEIETGLGVEGEVEEKDLGLGEEAGVGLTRETMTGREIETGQGGGGGTGLELDGETGMDGETRQTISETETGEMETGQGVGGEMGLEPGVRAGWKMDGGGGETLSDVPTSLLSSTSPCQEEQEREVMEEEQSGADEGEDAGMDAGIDAGMDTGDVDSLQSEELNLRC
ncbi:rho guanine nucleotide exchange factor 3 isoform X2 [Sebastes umbrosus]|uniref:rho guanine nucleotide exchange factor 3 isoform X2 n=1 Tax=Sebastes umbrosus TaxID=72105 RepID=UPI0018A10869|nr:rho guanine nucleotide exchange factor 3 isoform X2 [Sebastes umbrosus]